MKIFLYYGDNLKVLRKHIRDETVDLYYIDPIQLLGLNYALPQCPHGYARAYAIFGAKE